MNAERKKLFEQLLQEKASWAKFQAFKPMLQHMLGVWETNLSAAEFGVMKPLAEKFLRIDTEEQYNRLLLYAADRLSNAFDDILGFI